MHLYYITSYYDTIPYKHHIDYFTNKYSHVFKMKTKTNKI